MTRADEMRPVWGWALYTPAGRISDFFATADRAPQPRRWGDYRASDLEVIQVYVGDITPASTRTFYGLAEPGLGYGWVRERSPQAKWRNRWIAKHMLAMIADTPMMGPAD